MFDVIVTIIPNKLTAEIKFKLYQFTMKNAAKWTAKFPRWQKASTFINNSIWLNSKSWATALFRNILFNDNKLDSTRALILFGMENLRKK